MILVSRPIAVHATRSRTVGRGSQRMILGRCPVEVVEVTDSVQCRRRQPDSITTDRRRCPAYARRCLLPRGTLRRSFHSACATLMCCRGHERSLATVKRRRVHPADAFSAMFSFTTVVSVVLCLHISSHTAHTWRYFKIVFVGYNNAWILSIVEATELYQSP